MHFSYSHSTISSAEQRKSVRRHATRNAKAIVPNFDADNETNGNRGKKSNQNSDSKKSLGSNSSNVSRSGNFGHEKQIGFRYSTRNSVTVVQKKKKNTIFMKTIGKNSKNKQDKFLGNFGLVRIDKSHA